MLVLCKIAIAIMVGEIHFIQSVDVEGKVIARSESQYVVDFSRGLVDYKLSGVPSDYSKVLVEKNKCVKLN